jgi:hypothetical protein
MAIVKLVAIDPEPRNPKRPRALCFQIPENSREFEVLTGLLEQAGIPWGWSERGIAMKRAWEVRRKRRK